MAAAEPDRRLVGAVVVLCAAGLGAFVILRLVAPFHYTGWDEAYYLGIGANLLAGHGLQTAFGEFPSIHSPLWPLILQAPAALFGVDPTRWGHPLVVLSGATVIGLAGWYAWRSIRLAAPLAVAWLVAFPFLLDLAGWMGLDLPSAAMAMLYVGLGIAAVRRGSFTIGLVAGLVFAVAFLVKELVLPFAPVPIVAGLLRPTTLASIGRAAAGILLAAAVATSWWFLLYAQEVGLVYRLGSPAWTLLPLALGAIALVVFGLFLRQVAPWSDRLLEGGRARWAIRLGWLGALAWAGLLTAYFAIVPNPVGAPFLEPTQIAVILTRIGSDLWPIISLGLTGSVVAVVARIRPGLLGPALGEATSSAGLLRPDDRHAIDDLLVATICGLPFVLLTVSVGEGPRHFIAHLGFVVALGAIGWTKLLVSVARRPSPVRLAMVGLGALVVILAAARFAGPIRWLLLVQVAVAVAVVGIGLALAVRARRTPPRSVLEGPGRPAPTIVIGAILMIVVGSAIAVAASALPDAQTPLDATRASVVGTTTAWVREHLQPGSTVVFGSGFAMETSVELISDYRMALVAEEDGVDVEASAPVALMALDGAKAADWVALWASRRDVTALVGYRAGPVLESFSRLGPSVWIQTTLSSEESPSPLLEALDRAEGLEVLQAWSWPYGDDRLDTVVYRVDPTRLAFSDDIVFDPSALRRLIRTMERDPEAYRGAAARLLERAVLVSPEPGSADLLGRLRILAAR